MDNWRLNNLLTLLEEDDKDSFVHYALAQEYLKLNQTSDALVHFEHIRKHEPTYIGVYYHLAATYTEVNDNEKAMIIYNEGIAMARKLGEQHALSELMNAKMNLEIEL